MVGRANLALARGSLIYIYDPEALSTILLAIFNRIKEGGYKSGWKLGKKGFCQDTDATSPLTG
jgi:hypothetical protein